MMSLEIDNSYQLFFEWTVILVCYFFNDSQTDYCA